MKIYGTKRRRYRSDEDILDSIIGQDLWVLVEYNAGIGRNYYPRNLWVKILGDAGDCYYIAKILDDSTFINSISSLIDMQPSELDFRRIIRIYEPADMLTTEELAEEHIL